MNQNQMNQNPMQLFQTFAQLRNNPNPMQMAQNMFGNNPLFAQAIKMTEGKSSSDIKQTILNVAKEKNISSQELNQWALQFGISL